MYIVFLACLIASSLDLASLVIVVEIRILVILVVLFCSFLNFGHDMGAKSVST